MEMSQVRYVLAAAKVLNFTRAAQACNISQPALTKGIRALEEELGAEMFHREGRRILISDFGRTMLPHLQQIADEAAAAQALARNFRLLDKVPVRLGVLSTVGHVRLARFLSAFERGNPGLDLSVSEDGIVALADKLEAGEYDVVFMTAQPGLEARFNVQPLYEERYVVVLPPGHALVRRNTVSLADLDGENYVDRLACEMREMVMGVCAAEGIELYARFRSEREDWVQAMVLAGLGFAFMPEYSVTLPGLIQRPLIEPEVVRPVAALTVPGRRFSPATEALMRAMRVFAWPG